jgi:hypothetical protein
LLDHVVQLVERRAGVDEYLTPDRWPGVGQLDPQPLGLAGELGIGLGQVEDPSLRGVELLLGPEQRRGEPGQHAVQAGAAAIVPETWRNPSSANW